MAKHPDPRVTPYLLYANAGAALEWLAGAYGLKPYGKALVNDAGEVAHAAMRLGKGVVMLGSPGAAYRNPRVLGSVTQYLFVRVKQVDKHFARAKEAGARILEEPTDTPYGQRRYGSEDPEGHVWYFAQAIKVRKQKSGKRKSEGGKAKDRPKSATTKKKRRKRRGKASGRAAASATASPRRRQAKAAASNRS